MAKEFSKIVQNYKTDGLKEHKKETELLLKEKEDKEETQEENTEEISKQGDLEEDGRLCRLKFPLFCIANSPSKYVAIGLTSNRIYNKANY